MSCSWDILCVDCLLEAGIGDANHEDELMRVLIKHRDALASITELAEEAMFFELKVDNYYVLPHFFRLHAGHVLRPFSEYKTFDTLCKQDFVCPTCQTWVSGGAVGGAKMRNSVRKALISLWWSVGKWILREPPDAPLPACLGPAHSCHIDLNDAESWLNSHAGTRITSPQQRPMMYAEAFWSLTPIEKNLVFSWLWDLYGSERLVVEFGKMACSSEHAAVVRALEPLARAFGFVDPL